MKYDQGFIDALAVTLAAERASVEAELVGSILSNPAKGIEAAARAGVHCDLFDQDDLRAIYIAAEVAGDHTVLTVLRCARFLLRNLRLWDDHDTRSFARGMRWGNEALAAVACSYPGPAAVNHYARRLRRIDGRQREARECYRRIVGLLDGSIEPLEAAPGENVTKYTKHTRRPDPREAIHTCN